jgi:hypothetical protein
MSRIEVPAKIRTEDFDSEDRSIAEKIGGVYNNFVDQVYQQLSGGIDYENLRRQVVTLDITTDASSKAVAPPSIRYTLSAKLRGIHVLNAQNLVNSNIYPLAQPFISWTVNGQQIVILNVAGLPPNTQFRLTVELIA